MNNDPNQDDPNLEYADDLDRMMYELNQQMDRAEATAKKAKRYMIASAVLILINLIFLASVFADTRLERRVYEDQTFFIRESGTPERQYIFGPARYTPQPPVIQ